MLFNPFSYFSATADEVASDTANAANDVTSQAVAPVKSEGSPVASVIMFIIFAAVAVWFYSNCRVVGQRMGKNGKMEPIYDCSSPKQQPMMYAQPQPMMYAQPQPMMYAQPQPVVQPGGIFGFGRRRF